MGRKHGMALAAISGVNGPFSDADIRRVRKLALAARARHAVTARSPSNKKQTVVAARMPTTTRRTVVRRRKVEPVARTV
jgi:hypothetical protein